MPHPGGGAHEMGDYNPSPPAEWKTPWGRKPLYAIYPGTVPGKTVYLQPHSLAALYGVELQDCMVVREDEFDRPYNRGLREFVATLPALRPRADGKYIPVTWEASDVAPQR